MAETIRTPLCDLLGTKYPIILAGMNQVAGAELAAAVTNAGGLGMVGGVGYTPTFLRNVLKELKEKLDDDKKTQFGVDLLLPKVGGSARKPVEFLQSTDKRSRAACRARNSGLDLLMLLRIVCFSTGRTRTTPRASCPS